MIETECYKELNVFGPDETRTPDLILDQPPPPENHSCFPFRRRVTYLLNLGRMTDKLFYFILFFFCHFFFYLFGYWRFPSSSLLTHIAVFAEKDARLSHMSDLYRILTAADFFSSRRDCARTICSEQKRYPRIPVIALIESTKFNDLLLWRRVCRIQTLIPSSPPFFFLV